MKNVWIVVATLALSIATVTYAADEPQQPDKAVRTEMGEPLQQVQDLIAEGAYDTAGQRLEEITSEFQELTPYEEYILNRLRGSLTAAVGDYPGAVEAYRRVLRSGELSPEERISILNATGRMAYSAKMYPEAVELLGEYRNWGGRDRETLALLPQAHYMVENYAEAAEELFRQIEVMERAGERPPEYQLQLLGSVQVQINDIQGYLGTLRKSVAHYPSRETWDELIQRTAFAVEMPSRLMIQVYRLKQWTRTLDSAKDYMEATQLALQDGFPGEAQRFIEQGFEAGVLGKGAQAEINRHYRLRRKVESDIAEDKRTLGEGEQAAMAMSGGDALVNTGFNYITYGTYEKGLPLMREGIAKGKLKHPGDVKLLYGYGLLLSGRLDEGVDVFSEVGGDGAAYHLARLWILAVRGDSTGGGA
jgi:tetratricopeptide (TPR) repeat protein